ncbi:hypothetical protein GCM10025781_08420 [Kocuria gwangalliensis]|uniref:Short chain dehydrogenase n=1 Tax=Kocuria gwangalliensis TaxID=501592 RepID=A0ABP8WPV0_9MICC
MIGLIFVPEVYEMTPSGAAPEFKTVVVTGAAGGMGTARVAVLFTHGDAVASLDRPERDPW